MKQLLIVIGLFWVFLASANGRPNGIQIKRKLFVVSIGYAGDPNATRILESEKDGLRVQHYCPTCKTDAQFLGSYFEALGNKQMTGIDSVFIYSFTDGPSNLDKLFSVFDELRKKVGVDDYFIFYYASSCWMTKNVENGSGREAYYALNPDLLTKKDLNQGGFTLRHLKSLTDRLLTDNQLIVFDAGNGRVIQNDFYRNFFSDNTLEAGFSRKNRIILCPETASWETVDEKDGFTKGDLVRVISSMPDELNILSLLEFKVEMNGNDEGFQAVFESDRKSKIKLFMKAFWGEQLNAYAQIKLLREKEYLDLLSRIKPSTMSGKRGLGLARNENPESADTLLVNRTKKALIIATSEYQSDQWSRLKNPLNDGDSISNILVNKYGYAVDKKYNASREEILQAIDDLAGESSNNPYNQYVIYVAGHGFFDPRQQAGYLVCRDSKSIQNVSRPGTIELSTYIDYTTLYRRLGADLNRIVLIVDVCFGGASYNNFPGSQDLVDPSQEKNKKKQPYKKVIASGVTEVDDFIRTGSGVITRNSPFATELLRALRGGKKDVLDFDSVFGSLINAEPKLKPKPVQFSFGKTALSGEFIF